MSSKTKSKGKREAGEPAPASQEPVANTANELKELDAMGSEGSAGYDPVFPPAVYESYSLLQGYARDLNTRTFAPEFVLCGPSGAGKSQLLAALVGSPILPSNGTQRPLFFTFVNSPDVSGEPRITVKRDPELKQFAQDTEVSLSKLSKEIARRDADTPQPIIVMYEHAQVLNMTFIDTPGFNDSEERLALAASLARPTSRHILFVTSSVDHEEVQSSSFLKDLDPDMARTTLVFSKFYQHARKFNSNSEVNKYFASTHAGDARAFHTTLFTAGVLAASANQAEYQLRVWQANRRDSAKLEGLQFDRSYESSVGLHALRKFLLKKAWKSFQDDIPVILKTLRANKAKAQASLRDLAERLDRLSSSNLRALANTFVVEFLRIIDALISGTSEGNPTVNGQTLEEESFSLGLGEWKDAEAAPLTLYPDKIPYHSSRLYGGQQFKRLLSVFSDVVGSTSIAEPSLDEIATAAGVNKLNNVPNYAWAACELAAREAKRSLVPLIQQLETRAKFVMRRLPDIARGIMNTRNRTRWNAQPALAAENIAQYPYFVSYVIELFDKFVEEQARECKQKCLDEFFNTRTIYWHLAEDEAGKLPVDRGVDNDTKGSVVELSSQVFAQLRARISDNVQLKFYNFFLVPLQTTLWNDIQEHVNTLTNVDLAQKFEVEATTARLRRQEASITDDVERYQEQETALLEAATRFAHPVLKA